MLAVLVRTISSVSSPRSYRLDDVLLSPKLLKIKDKKNNVDIHAYGKHQILTPSFVDLLPTVVRRSSGTRLRCLPTSSNVN